LSRPPKQRNFNFPLKAIKNSTARKRKSYLWISQLTSRKDLEDKITSKGI